MIAHDFPSGYSLVQRELTDLPRRPADDQGKEEAARMAAGPLLIPKVVKRVGEPRAGKKLQYHCDSMQLVPRE